jgi:hypothetical protein
LALILHEGESGYSDIDSDDGNSKHVAFVTIETALFPKHILLLGSQSSINIVAEENLRKKGTNRRTRKGIVSDGVDKETPGTKVDLVGELGDIGMVYYCPKAAINILSFAAMSDAGVWPVAWEPTGLLCLRLLPK